ncbi:Mobile element protein [hydrothermal vent metagenome]|uniref:Mobile element protein n=1 Tax=hydrothermal vent metagenome TaxID=652676 RepID=A0A3B0TXU5_9ZZZZ
MNKDTKYYGVDISKDVFDVMDEKGVHSQFKNNCSGFKKYLKLLDSHCVMEATGYYHYKLACFLLENANKKFLETDLPAVGRLSPRGGVIGNPASGRQACRRQARGKAVEELFRLNCSESFLVVFSCQ